MPPATRKKASASSHNHLATAPAKQQRIGAFGKISKPQPYLTGKKDVLAKDSISSIIHEHSSEFGATNLKRKSNVSVTCSDEEAESATIFQNPGHDANTNTPRKKRCMHATVTKISTKEARSQEHSFASPSSSPIPNFSPIARCDGKPPSSPALEPVLSSDHEDFVELPFELQDLINLHAAFLTAISLHFAHNGPMTPAELRILGPSVEQAWRKRKVTIEDVRRVLGLVPGDDSLSRTTKASLHLTDYGQGKVCVESPASSFPQAHIQSINKGYLVDRFANVLRERWVSYRLIHTQYAPVDAFISALPLLPIMPCASLSKIGPLRAKGQRRLEDLKAGAIRAQQRPLASTSANISSPPFSRKQTTARSSDLFSRVHAKQMHQASLPLPMSAEVVARKAALQRLPEIAPVIGNLALSSQKHRNDDAEAEDCNLQTTHVSFTMATLVQHLQMSLRNPVAKDEAIGCIRLLAEVAPEWVGIREVGKLVGVTVTGSTLGRKMIEERVRSLSEKLEYSQRPLRS